MQESSLITSEVAALNLVFQPRVVWSTILLIYSQLYPKLRCILAKLLDFSWTGPYPLFTSPSRSFSRIVVPTMIWCSGYRIPFFKWWCDFNPRVRISYTLFLFTGSILLIFLPVSVSRSIFYPSIKK